MAGETQGLRFLFTNLKNNLGRFSNMGHALIL